MRLLSVEFYVGTGFRARSEPMNFRIVDNPSAISRIRLDANAIIDRQSNPLFAPKVALCRLNRNVSQEELDLLQLASRRMAEPSTGPTQIVWRQLHHAKALGGFLHNVPNCLHRHAISPSPSKFVDPAEQFSSINCGCGELIVQFGSHPIRDRNRSNVASLADQINNSPMLFALLEMIQSQRHRFMSPQSTREQ